MKPTKEKRDLLFKRSRPHIRKAEESDMWVLWAAYDMGSFPNLPKGMVKAQFTAYVGDFMRKHSSCLVIEDDSRYFKAKRGPVAFLSIDNFGWRIEPHVDFFKWAKTRCILRCNVTFFQMVRYSSEIGVCLVRSPEATVPLFNTLREYGVLFPCGRIPDGSPAGDEWLFYVRGKHARIDGVRRSSERTVQRASDVQRPDAPSEERNPPSERTDAVSEPARPSGDAAGQDDWADKRRYAYTGGIPAAPGERVSA